MFPKPSTRNYNAKFDYEALKNGQLDQIDIHAAPMEAPQTQERYDELLPHFLAALPGQSRLSKLVLSGPFEQSQWDQVIAAFAAYGKLKEIAIQASESFPFPDAVTKLRGIFAGNPGITTLTCSNHADTSAILSLALQDLPNLQNLNLRKMFINSSAAQSIAQLLAHNKPNTSLRLPECTIAPDAIAVLCVAIRNATGIVAVDLSRPIPIDYDDTTAEPASTDFAGPQLLQSIWRLPALSEVNLSGHVVDITKARFLAAMLRNTSRKLQHLSLNGCGMSEEEAKVLYAGLADNKTLTTLSLRSNDDSYSCEGNGLLRATKILAKVAAEHPTLRSIDISGNADTIADSDTLEDHYKLWEEILQALKEAVNTNPDLVLSGDLLLEDLSVYDEEDGDILVESIQNLVRFIRASRDLKEKIQGPLSNRNDSLQMRYLRHIAESYHEEIFTVRLEGEVRKLHICREGKHRIVWEPEVDCIIMLRELPNSGAGNDPDLTQLYILNRSSGLDTGTVDLRVSGNIPFTDLLYNLRYRLLQGDTLEKLILPANISRGHWHTIALLAANNKKLQEIELYVGDNDDASAIMKDLNHIANKNPDLKSFTCYASDRVLNNMAATTFLQPFTINIADGKLTINRSLSNNSAAGANASTATPVSYKRTRSASENPDSGSSSRPNTLRK